MKVKRVITAFDTHSSGMTSRIILGGFPEIPGETMLEKTRFCRENLDHLRRAVMLRPRGFKGILGAIVTRPTRGEADFGVVYTHSEGYFNACGDSTFAAVKALIESGRVEKEEPVTELVLDTAGGLLPVKATIREGEVEGISYEGTPSFYCGHHILDVHDLEEVEADIAFGGLYYAFVDARKLGMETETDNAAKLIRIGLKIMDAANEQVKIKHPTNPALDKIQLVTFSDSPKNPEHDYRHANVQDVGFLCISPAGTSVSAKLATYIAKGEMKMGERIVVESPVDPGIVMTGRAVRETKVGNYKAIIPELSANAYVTGIQQFVIEEGDPIKYGFVMA
ncbi:MAG: proline racemase family protein [Candidatus Bathyarchaeia archaeon]